MGPLVRDAHLPPSKSLCVCVCLHTHTWKQKEAGLLSICVEARGNCYIIPHVCVHVCIYIPCTHTRNPLIIHTNPKVILVCTCTHTHLVAYDFALCTSHTPSPAPHGCMREKRGTLVVTHTQHSWRRQHAQQNDSSLSLSR